MDEYDYVGEELTIFAHAVNWKKYYASLIKPYFGKRVVEVGAGLGATTPALCDGSQEEWICLEPDDKLRVEIDRLISNGKLPSCCKTRGGFISDLQPRETYNTFVYIDVLEHIENDRAELEAASRHLVSGGTLIVLSPAFNFLYSPFDKAIGHFRRYDAKTLHLLTPEGFRIERLMYLDAVGMTTSLINRLFLRQSMPALQQILFWDRNLIPLSKIVDRALGYRMGRTIVCVWRKE